MAGFVSTLGGGVYAAANSCMTIPVAYNGERPIVGSKIIAYGKLNIDKERRRFINMFNADTIKPRDNDFKGNTFYFMRKVSSFSRNPQVVSK